MNPVKILKWTASILTILLFVDMAKSQEIKVDNINKNCEWRATAIDSIVAKIKSNCEQTSQWVNVHNNPINPKERISFLNNDFATEEFLMSCEVKCADFTIDGGFHLGIIDIGLEKNDMDRCLQAIRSSQRQNF